MLGDERFQDEMFSVVTLEQRVPQDHPLREIRKLTDAVLVSLNAELGALSSVSGRPSIAPKYVLPVCLSLGLRLHGSAGRWRRGADQHEADLV
jgi:transposase